MSHFPLLGPHGRRGFLTVVGGGLAALAVAGCSDDASDDAPLSESGGTPAAGSTEASAFPVTVSHRYGETTVPAAPKRIVALGQTDCDPLIALGLTPIAIGSFVAGWYEPVKPWNEAGFPDGDPEELNFYEPEFERIAALQPDLITMVSGGITKAHYETLSKIAPVVAAPDGYQDSAVPYGPHTLLIGQAVGLEAEAQAVVDDVDAQYAAAREAHPEWATLHAVHAECYAGEFDVLGRNAPRTTYLTALGFQLDPTLDDLTGEDYNQALSAEKLDLVGGLDLVVWCTDGGEVPDVQGNELVQALDVVQDGRSLWISGAKTDNLMWAMDANTVLSGPYALEVGIPLIESALAGESPVSEGA
jgi:iron complex transport system substrate-binding protein